MRENERERDPIHTETECTPNMRTDGTYDLCATIILYNHMPLIGFFVVCLSALVDSLVSLSALSPSICSLSTCSCYAALNDSSTVRLFRFALFLHTRTQLMALLIRIYVCERISLNFATVIHRHRPHIDFVRRNPNNIPIPSGMSLRACMRLNRKSLFHFFFSKWYTRTS